MIGIVRRLAMTELDFGEVIERFDAILDAVERGESFRVFRNGQPIAVLEPAESQDLGQADVPSPTA
jgi:antitoxin (DNA-binding transcriptional repressor) of toxin-antitoxin stability system